MVITPVRHSTPVRYEYATRYYCTVPASYVREYSRTGTVLVQHGEYCVNYSTVRVQYSRTSTGKRMGLSTVQYVAVP